MCIQCLGHFSPLPQHLQILTAQEVLELILRGYTSLFLNCFFKLLFLCVCVCVCVCVCGTGVWSRASHLLGRSSTTWATLPAIRHASKSLFLLLMVTVDDAQFPCTGCQNVGDFRVTSWWKNLPRGVSRKRKRFTRILLKENWEARQGGIVCRSRTEQRLYTLGWLLLFCCLLFVGLIDWLSFQIMVWVLHTGTFLMLGLHLHIPHSTWPLVFCPCHDSLWGKRSPPQRLQRLW
jgi:hypothetical protein